MKIPHSSRYLFLYVNSTVFGMILGVLIFLSTHSKAQTADELARFNARIGAQIGDLVIQNNNLVVQIGTLQSQLASAQQRVKDLEAKAAEAPKPSEDK